jgi:FkbM family methyltransferase
VANLKQSVFWYVRLAAQRVGLDLRRYPHADPVFHVARLLTGLQVGLVLDVGAHRGKYAAELRRFGYAGRIWSFEPLTEPFADLRRRSADDPLWATERCAIGDRDGWVTVNVAGNKAAASSVLPMLDAHQRAAPDAAYVGAEDAPLRRLDDLVTDGRDRVFLKADVQGYEGAVLDGAAQLLKSGRVVGLQLECSFVPLYDGGTDWREMFSRADDLGMELVRLDPGFTDSTGRTLWADVVFLRHDPGASG